MGEHVGKGLEELGSGSVKLTEKETGLPGAAVVAIFLGMSDFSLIIDPS